MVCLAQGLSTVGQKNRLSSFVCVFVSLLFLRPNPKNMAKHILCSVSLLCFLGSAWICYLRLCDYAWFRFFVSWARLVSSCSPRFLCDFVLFASWVLFGFVCLCCFSGSLLVSAGSFLVLFLLRLVWRLVSCRVSLNSTL